MPPFTREHFSTHLRKGNYPQFIAQACKKQPMGVQLGILGVLMPKYKVMIEKLHE